MERLHRRLLLWTIVARRQLTPASLALGWGVAARWLLFAGAVAFLLPASVGSASIAHVNLPGMPSVYSALPIAGERVAFDEAQRGYREGSEAVVDHAHTAYEWIEVAHHQAVRIVARDSDAVEVELLEGWHAGRRSWLKNAQLSP
jgi:hypothetical protein